MQKFLIIAGILTIGLLNSAHAQKAESDKPKLEIPKANTQEQITLQRKPYFPTPKEPAPTLPEDAIPDELKSRLQQSAPGQPVTNLELSPLPQVEWDEKAQIIATLTRLKKEEIELMKGVSLDLTKSELIVPERVAVSLNGNIAYSPDSNAGVRFNLVDHEDGEKSGYAAVRILPPLSSRSDLMYLVSLTFEVSDQVRWLYPRISHTATVDGFLNASPTVGGPGPHTLNYVVETYGPYTSLSMSADTGGWTLLSVEVTPIKK